MQTISLKLPDDLLAQLASEAKARRVTKSWLVRESLEKALRSQSRAGAVSCYDLARDLAGTVKGLPEDLAENRDFSPWTPISASTGATGTKSSPC